ncbi:MAG: hypothetical protein AAF823_00730 [Planctomycetota bacterium]
MRDRNIQAGASVRPGQRWTTLSLATAAVSVAPWAAAQQEISFGDFELFDFDTFANETRYGWTSGDSLVADIDLNTRVGAIVGRKDQRISPAVKAFGVTVIPEIRADTRSGARLTSSLDARAGVQLNAGVTVGGDGFDATLQAGPTLTVPGPVETGQFFQLRGGSGIGASSTFDPGLPKFDAGLDVILEGNFQNKFEYGLFPLAGYTVGEFGLDFDFNFNLFDFEFDLNLPELSSINFPDLPSFEIPDSQDDNTLLRQKIPPSNPALSIAEVAIDNPLASISTDTELTADGRLTTSTSGSIARAGLDIDGVVSALATGVSFTGTEVKIGPGKLAYDIIDVKYGLELGIEYDTEVDPFINATLTFKDELGNPTSVLMKNDDGTTTEVMSYTGRWDELPEFSLLSREDVTVDVDFTDIEAIFTHGAALTLSDYMELQALKASASVAPGVKIVDIGPAYYQKFPLAGELAAFPVFDDSFSLGSLDILDGLWDGSFVIEAAPAVEMALDSPTAELTLADLRQIDSGTQPASLADAILVIGDYTVGDLTRQDVAPVSYTDAGSFDEFVLTTSYIDSPIPVVRQATATVRQAGLSEVTSVDAFVVVEGSSYRLDDGASRRFSLDAIANDGVIEGDGYLEFAARAATLTIEGDGYLRFDNHPGKIHADTLIHGEGHTLEFGAFAESNLVQTGFDLEDWPEIPAGALPDPVLGQQLNGSSDYTLGKTTLVSEHTFDVNSLDNSGTIVFNGSDFDLALTDLFNRVPGTIRVEGDTSVSINNAGGATDQERNSGLIEAVGTDAYLDVRYTSIRGVVETDPDTGVESIAQGRVVARDGSLVQFTGASAALREQSVEASDGGTVTFDGLVQMLNDTRLYTDSTGTINLNGGLEVFVIDGFDLVNEGTLNVNSNVDLRPATSDNGTRDDPSGNPAPIFPIGLTNTGTINVSPSGQLNVGAVLRDFSNNGAALVGGTWNLLGNDGAFSNLDSTSSASLGITILGVENEDEVFFDILGGVTEFDTTLKNNAADVRINGVASFEYFNTVEVNQGSFTISGGHQFVTVDGYTNSGGTTVVETGADLLVRGALKVLGGSVSVDATSGLSAETQTEVIDEEGTLRDVTVEVIGGTLSIADAAVLIAPPTVISNGPDIDPDGKGPLPPVPAPAIVRTAALTDRPDLEAGVNYVGLNAGQVWIVSEQVVIDPDTEAETVVPATIDLGSTVIERNDGEITISGASASFDAAEGMRYNHGKLTLEGGFVFDTREQDFRNAAGATLRLSGSEFVVTGETGEFRNDGELVMDGDSYLFADQFTNGAGASLQLDGVLEAGLVVNAAGASIMGSGAISGSIQNDGLLDLGSSPGLIESFGDYTQGAAAMARFEIAGNEAGVSYDQLAVSGAVGLGGDVELALLDGYTPTLGDVFVLIDGDSDEDGDELLTGRFASISGVVIDDFLSFAVRYDAETADVVAEVALRADYNLDGVVDTSDLAILASGFGQSGQLWSQGDATGDGLVDTSDLASLASAFGRTSASVPLISPTDPAALAAVPEPGVLALLGGAGLLWVRRREHG